MTLILAEFCIKDRRRRSEGCSFTQSFWCPGGGVWVGGESLVTMRPLSVRLVACTTVSQSATLPQILTVLRNMNVTFIMVVFYCCLYNDLLYWAY